MPLGQVDGPVLWRSIAGGHDALWPVPAPFPYVPAGVRTANPVNGGVLQLGGSRAGNAAVKGRGRPEMLAFLAAMGR